MDQPHFGWRRICGDLTVWFGAGLILLPHVDWAARTGLGLALFSGDSAMIDEPGYYWALGLGGLILGVRVWILTGISRRGVRINARVIGAREPQVPLRGGGGLTKLSLYYPYRGRYYHTAITATSRQARLAAEQGRIDILVHPWAPRQCILAPSPPPGAAPS